MCIRDRIESLVDGLAARRKLMLIDTCESGERPPEETARLATALGAAGLTARGLELVESGAPAGAEPPPAIARTPMQTRERLIFADLFRRTGTIIFNSSSGTEPSLEREDIKNGLFTHAFVRALAEGDHDGDGFVDTDELRRYVQQEVVKRSGGLQHPSVDRDNLAQTIRLPALSAAKP